MLQPKFYKTVLVDISLCELEVVVVIVIVVVIGSSILAMANLYI